MRLLGLVAISLAACVAVAAAAEAKRSPRLEQLAPRAADTKRAQKGLIRMSDLAPGWKGGPVKVRHSEAPDCKWQDFSRFTITGEAEADFAQANAPLVSNVQMFPSHAQALGDFRAGTKPALPKCAGEVLRKRISPTAKLVSALTLKSPKVGDHAAAYRFVIRVGKNLVYVDLIQFVRDRAVAGLFALTVGGRVRGLDVLAGVMDVRLQSNVA